MAQKEICLLETGRRIMERRKKLGLTQEALAEKGEVTTQFVSYAESGKRAMRPENLMKISEALGVSADYLLGRESRADAGRATDSQLKSIAAQLRELADIAESYTK